MRVLFVCTGNTCRSPMAEALFRRLLTQRPGQAAQVEVMSAGIAAHEGAPMAAHARQVLGESGAEAGMHRARQLTPELVRTSDLVLTMTEAQKREVLQRIPEARGKVFTLKEYALGPQRRRALEQRLESLTSELERQARRLESQQGVRIEELRARRAALTAELDRIDAAIEQWERAWRTATQEVQAEAERIRAQLGDLDVDDPVHQPIDAYRRTAREIEQALRQILEQWGEDPPAGGRREQEQ